MRTADKTKVVTTVAATSTALLFITLNSFFQSHSVLFLSIEVVLLPAIYIIGNIYAEGRIHDTYQERLGRLFERSQNLQEKYYNLKIEYLLLEEKLWEKEDLKQEKK